MARVSGDAFRVESTNLRVAFAVIGLLALVVATLFTIGYEIVVPNVKSDMHALAMLYRGARLRTDVPIF